jgi:heat shock protein HslJ
MRNILISMLLALTILSSFNKKTMAINDFQNYGNENKMLDSAKWRLTRIFNSDSFMQVTSSKAFIRFNAGEGRINGNGSCNSFGGKLSVDGNSLKLGNIFSTKMYCNEVPAIENEIFSQLQKVTRYTLNEKKLTLFNGDDAVLEFEAG